MRTLRKSGKPPGNGNNNYAARSRWPEKYPERCPEKLGAAWNWWSEKVVTKRWSENINGWVGRTVGRNQEKIYSEGRVPTRAPAPACGRQAPRSLAGALGSGEMKNQTKMRVRSE